MIRIAVLTFSVLLITSTFAQAKIDPRCKRMKKPVACTCAVQNGGYIDTAGHWHSKTGRRGSPSNDAYIECVRRKGIRS
jgi:hypothetical protein